MNNCVAGVMITASHNPSKYNGYRVYNADGCQITIDATEMIQNEIVKVNMFHDVKDISFEQGMNNGLLCYVPEKVYTDYIEEVKNRSMLGGGDTVDKNLPIIYSPLNGTGLKPVLRTLTESSFTNVIVDLIWYIAIKYVIIKQIVGKYTMKLERR